MSYRNFAVMVIAISAIVVAYILAVDNESNELVADSGDITKPTIKDLTATNHPVGKPLSNAFHFRNTQDQTITVTKLRPCCIGTSVQFDRELPLELPSQDEIAFTVSITPGPNDFGSATAAYVYWKDHHSDEEHMDIFRINFTCAFEWVLSSLKVDLGKLNVGKEIPPVTIQLNRLKESQFAFKRLKIDSSDRIKVRVEELEHPRDICPQTPIERQHSANIIIELPTPQNKGGYAESITVKDDSSDHIEVIELFGVVSE